MQKILFRENTNHIIGRLFRKVGLYTYGKLQHGRFHWIGNTTTQRSVIAIEKDGGQMVFVSIKDGLLLKVG